MMNRFFKVVLALAALVYCEVSQAANEIESFELLSSPGLSGRIAFGAGIKGIEQIFLLDIDARKVRPLVSGPGDNRHPSISPNGEEVSFLSDRDGFSAVYVSEWSGENPRRITGADLVPSGPSWNGSGSKIVFSARTKKHADGPSNIYEADHAAVITQITQLGGNNLNPSWSPDGKVIAYQTDRFWPGLDICAWNLALKTESCLLTGTKSFLRPVWSYNGKLLAFSFGAYEASELGVLRLDSATRLHVASTQRKIHDAAWSPDDKHLAICAESSTKGILNIFVSDLEDRVIPLVRSTYSIHGLSWSGVKTITLEAKRARKTEIQTTTPSPVLKSIPTTSLPSVSQSDLLREFLGPEGSGGR